ncbi:hypothetical protein KY218_000602 [Serratia marcescens]|nr:hypothetical protein [Serratia marcescens]EIJ6671703.1 hypothetical protein [Serratia marcescens]
MNIHPWTILSGKMAEQFPPRPSARVTWWTKERVAELRRLAPNHTITEMSLIMGASTTVIRSKAEYEGILFKKVRHHTPKEQARSILRKYAGKLSAAEIGELFGLSTKTIYRLAQNTGISLQRYGDNHHSAKVSSNDVELCRALYEEGVPVTIIAEKMELPKRYVSQVIRFYGRKRDPQ